jgi:hypothetical protein
MLKHTVPHYWWLQEKMPGVKSRVCHICRVSDFLEAEQSVAAFFMSASDIFSCSHL